MAHIPIKKDHQFIPFFKKDIPLVLLQTTKYFPIYRHKNKAKKKDTHDTFKDLPKPGHPRIFTGRDERNIMRLISNDDYPTVASTQKKLKSVDKIEVSTSTIK